ncbi:Surfactin synthase thioesterase subunit [Kibdelosporangium sp. 4NS15]|uniref:Surfactin synthase thioesterase subunit n=1 Tax=Kibdelosporangium persicum TaxID=2698649 RepID=A0ABX2FES3_9PSEU|nr:lantibiotic dehydratase [Kibdelosporangium persicum]NRN69392.1 Surfactin synthase thioesterase subunit [Kibdelosporangium persicum]
MTTTFSPSAVRAGESPAHRFTLGDTGWSIWRDALLRTTGFPAAWVDRLAAPECAAIADACLAGEAGTAEFEARFAETLTESSGQVDVIAGDVRLREAITWQNPAVAGLLDSLRRSGPPKPRNSKRRYREVVLARFWQRYCTKTETIGFFGPGCWIKLDPREQDVRATPGDDLLARREVFLEPWALTTYAATLAEDPRTKLWLPPSPMPHHLLDGEQLHRPGSPPLELTSDEAAVVALCDGTRTAADILRTLGMSERDGSGLLDDLVRRKVLRWDPNLPVSPHTETLLAQRIAAIEPADPRFAAQAGLDRLRAARDQVAKAAGDPDALASAMSLLENTFSELTGKPARRRSGQMYAGRGICYEDTSRDLRMVIGRRLLDDLAPALGIVLQAARWLTSELGRTYEQGLRRLFGKVAQDVPHPTLADLWHPAIDLFWGDDVKPVDRIARALAGRWAELFPAGPGDKRVRRDATALSGQVDRLFAAERPGWSWARVHSPDLIVCAKSVADINSGDFTAVLGELHLAYAPMTDRWCTWSRDEPDLLLRQTIEDFGRTRMVPLFPAMWSRDAGRNVQIEDAPTDRHIGFAKATGVDARRVVPTVSVRLHMTGDRLMGRLPDGEDVPVLEFFAHFLSTTAVNMFRGLSTAAHTPRVTIDRLVLFRETWRTRVAELADLLTLKGDAARYLAGRRLVARLGLPDRCFVKIATERKPVYVDFTSPLYVASLCTMLRATRDEHGDRVDVVISEMLPTPDQTWIPDAAGNHYFGEIRLQITDPAPAATVGQR